MTLTLPPGPRRLIDDGDRPRFHVARGRRRSGPKGRRPSLRQCRKILVVRLDHIGDWVLTTPFLENLRRNAPQAEITAVVVDRVFALAASCRFADRVVSLCRAEGRRLVFGAQNAAMLHRFREDFTRGVFDLALVPRFDADFNGALQVAHGARPARLAGFSEASTERRRVLNRGDDRFYTDAVVDRRPAMHEAERNLALIAALGGRIGPMRPAVHPSPTDERRAARYLRESFGDRRRDILAVAPFGSEPKRTLPPDRLVPVIRGLAARFGLGVAIVGSPGEAGAAGALAGAIGDAARVAAGALDVGGTAALLRHAAGFIGMDSGPAHIAAAMGTPVVVLSCHPANGSPAHANAPERFAPLANGAEVLVIRPQTATAPCREGCEAGRAHCILALTPDALRPCLEAFVERALAMPAGIPARFLSPAVRASGKG